MENFTIEKVNYRIPYELREKDKNRKKMNLVFHELMGHFGQRFEKRKWPLITKLDEITDQH